MSPNIGPEKERHSSLSMPFPLIATIDGERNVHCTKMRRMGERRSGGAGQCHGVSGGVRATSFLPAARGIAFRHLQITQHSEAISERR